MQFAEKRGPETLAVSALILLFMLFLRPLLMTCTRMLSHDSIWFYGIFHHFADSLSNGFFPYWDPFDYSGQPFYCHIGGMYILNPITIALIYLNKFLNGSLVTVYHWHFVLQLIVTGAGVYLCCRKVTRYNASRLIALAVFLFGSFTMMSMRQPGILYSFAWYPWALFFLLRLTDEFSAYNCAGLGLFTGLSMLTYQGLYVVLSLAVFGLTFILNKRAVFAKAFTGRGILCASLAVIITLLLGMSLIGLYAERDEFSPIARMRTSLTPDKDLYTERSGGVACTAADFKGLADRRLASRALPDMFASQSDVLFHIGYIPLALALAGLVFAKGGFKINFFVMAVFFTLIMLRNFNEAILPVLDFILPPFKYVRHAQFFGGYFIFTLIYFAALGSDAIIGLIKEERARLIAGSVLFLFAALDIYSYANGALPNVTLKRENLKFTQTVTPTVFSARRKERIATDDPIRYYKPLLYKTPTAFNSASIAYQFTNGHLRYGLDELVSGMRGGGRFAFSAAAKRRNAKDFAAYGIAEFRRWGKDDRLAFLDTVIVMLYDIAAHRDFYGSFEGFENLYMGLRYLIESGYKAIKKEDKDWVPGTQEQKLLNMLLELKLKPEPGATSRRYSAIGKTFDFQERVALHGYFFGSLVFADYLDYVWRRNHVEEFVLILKKDYKEFMDIYEDLPEKRELIIEKQRSAAGISADIIRFYPEAMFLSVDRVKDYFSNSPDDVLLLEGEGEGGAMEFEAAAEAYKDRKVDFTYAVNKYLPHDMEVECDSSCDGYLYYSDNFDRHWRAFIDGSPAGIYRANMAFKAIKLPAGRHIVRFLYDPRFFRISLVVYYAVIAICVLYLVSAGFKKQHKKEFGLA